MILDSSAVVASIGRESDSARYQSAILAAPSVSILSVAVLETRIVLQSRRGAEAVQAFERMLEEAGIPIIPFDAELAKIAFEAFRRFGKGQGHPAQLNIVDCAVYALAKLKDEPLLFKGADFDKTDIRSAFA